MRQNLFYNWMETQVYRQDPIGDFARDIKEDPLFPRKAKLINPMRKYLKNRMGSYAPILKVLQDAFDEYHIKGQKEYMMMRLYYIRDKASERLQKKVKKTPIL